MIASAVTPQSRSLGPIPPLENAEMLNLAEFLRRYEDMHDVKKAELIEGITHMPSPVRIDLHAKPDGMIHGWLFTYAIEHGLEFYPNATLLLDTENSFQPDAILCSKPRKGGRVWLNAKGYLCGAPELVVEVAASTASIDLRDKLRVYRRNGVNEYIVWRTQDKEVDWFVLKDGEYVPQSLGRDHKLRSSTFAGLVLDVKALLALDGAKLVAALKKG
ncbi:putative restriction endonuclease [Prosthecobacter fusiformis]|uniref:Putative restriction endonuclease n=1 Tax=Prosthecobacter fusiformis TaxID=48464 RepID=A0A4R7SQV0_9BACT|nr:Uma2 family endonuclease [Prosthecobacter fusiformis]TDU80999.1 putative restriction endonuclease [Prosthecobacter fusiformis]